MGISLKTHKRLWGNAANRCAFAECKELLFETHFDTDDFTTVGDEAHIVSGQIGGPRFSDDFPKEKVDTYDNLILLRKKHHAIIDSDVAYYTAEQLRATKQAHENWVSVTLNINKEKQRDEELYADYVDQIETLADFDHWDEWTYPLCGGSYTRLSIDQHKQLIALHRFLSSRVYPATKLPLRSAFELFHEVLEDLLNEFSTFMIEDPYNPGWYAVQQLYRLGTITAEKQIAHEYLIDALTHELTKAANRLCNTIRAELHRTYRLAEGILLIKDQPISGIAFLRLEYGVGESYIGYVSIRQKVEQELRGGTTRKS